MGVRSLDATVTTIVAAVGTVHESAAVCDNLDDRDDVDAVVGVGVAPSNDPAARRDADEAPNVLAVRLPELDVQTERRDGDPALVVPMIADDHDADEIVVAEGFAGREAVESASERPVVVVEDPAG